MDKKRLVIISIIILLFLAAILWSFLYYRGKLKVTFNTGTDEVIMSQYVKRNSKVTEPLSPSKDGYIFIEWQLDGKKYDFDSKVNNDLELTAKWLKENYITINYITNTDLNIDSIKIISGDTISELPNVEREGYEFKGWYLNGVLYDGREVYSDSTLVAEYKNDKIDTTYKVGDKIIVTGNYSKSSYSKESKNKKAIGWEREIIDIIEDGENPYVIGNSKGVTGYFKASSIELIK